MSEQKGPDDVRKLFEEKYIIKVKQKPRPDLKPDPMYTSMRRQMMVIDKTELAYWDGKTQLQISQNILQRTVDDTRSLCNLVMWEGLTDEEFKRALFVAKVNAQKFDRLCGTKTSQKINDILVTCLPDKNGKANCFVMPATYGFLKHNVAQKPVSLMKEHQKAVIEEARDIRDAEKREKFITLSNEAAPKSLYRQTSHQPPTIRTINLKEIPRIEI